MLLSDFATKRPGSSVVEHLHGKQVVVGSIPILGKVKFLEPNGGC